MSADAEHQSLFKLLAAHLDRAESDEILCFLGKKASEERMSWSQFLGRSASRAQEFTGHGVLEGDILPIMREIGADLVCDFFGAILLGAIPCVLAPPNPRMAPEVFRRKLLGMLGEKTIRHLVCDTKLRVFLERVLSIDVELLSPDSRDPLDPRDMLQRQRDQRAPLFLQHSSGTTGVPKAVMISEGQLLNQLRAYGKSIKVNAEDQIVSWLPLYHDMGMIACLWGAIVWGTPTTHMSNFSWVLRPAMMLEAITRERGTLAWMPNFAFALMAANVPEDADGGLDLSSMRAWISCSEPVYDQAFAAFLKRFESLGVSSSQLGASYAMAENVFAISQTKIGQSPTTLEVDETALAAGRVLEKGGAKRLVSSGRLIEGVELEVRGEADIGELIVSGACVIDGYFGNPEATAAAIDQGRYSTGDLGFIRDGEVYVVGRSRDMIIVGGRNLDPGEVEFALSEVDSIIAGRVCTLGLIDAALGTESVHVLLETQAPESEHAAIALAVKKTVAAATSHQVRRVWCLPKGWLIKSSAGKMARKECKAKLLEEYPELEGKA